MDGYVATERPCNALRKSVQKMTLPQLIVVEQKSSVHSIQFGGENNVKTMGMTQ
jgi:hypothetical protein